MYYHGVVNGLVDEKLLDILKDREISSASKRMLVNRIGFNEGDYISLCKYMGEEVYKSHPNNAFNKYIIDNFCFIISDDIEVEKPVYIEDASTMNRFDLMKLRTDNPDKRFSDLIDEYQARYFIPFEKVIAIGIPYHRTPTISNLIKLSNFTYFTPDEYSEFISKIESIAEDYGIPVVDSSNPEFMLEFEERRRAKK